MSSVASLKDLSVSGKKVLVRVDFNVPTDGEQVTDNSRIKAALPTLEYLLEQGARIILMSHLGRPKGEANPKYTLRPVANELANLVGRPVLFLEECMGPKVEEAVGQMQDGNIVLLENLRYHAGEEKNDPEMASALARLADVYVNDAFGTAHRAHASTAGVPALVSEKAAGLLVEKELKFLGERTRNPERPFVVILGGAKVSDKINVINQLLEKADTILIGGAMAYTFALAQGKKVGDSLCEPDKIETAKAALAKAEEKGVKFLLPVDNLIAKGLDFGGKSLGETDYTKEGSGIPDGWEGVDIGPKTTEMFVQEVTSAKTILWNGPMGIFEIEASSKGTYAIAKAVAENQEATSIIGGGDSVSAVNKSGYSDKVSFMSTGGGASLEFLEGKELPGVKALEKA
ncbi:MAG: phosphoglycerate kinase [Opitutales bacterium]|nr:phosphoglycerate kinase [Opitutales bacterium]MCH8539909.1 phosphoglycerate kinase [Opitutales bacterium]